jgi:hypothetical protein
MIVIERLIGSAQLAVKTERLREGDQRGTKPQPEAACVDRRIERFPFSREEAARF